MPETTNRLRPNENAGRTTRLASLLVAVASVGYMLVLLALVVAFRCVGERWWPTTIALYLPRAGWGLPLPFLTLALLFQRRYRLLVTQVVSTLVVLFPLMGLQLHFPAAATAGAFQFRIFTLNIGYGQNSIKRVLARIHDARADIVVLEAVSEANLPELRAGLAGLSFQSFDQFVIASRFPVESPFEPPPLDSLGERIDPQYMRCRVVTPGGPIWLYAVHPDSPHSAFNSVRGEGLREEVLTGRAFGVDLRGEVRRNARLRMAQIRAVAEDAARSPEPVLVAGDTNLPGLSWAFSNWFGQFQDAFAEAGFGFGYTYPAHKVAWMRIDRILGGPQFRFRHVVSVSPPAYQHLGLVADVEIRMTQH